MVTYSHKLVLRTQRPHELTKGERVKAQDSFQPLLLLGDRVQSWRGDENISWLSQRLMGRLSVE